MAKAIVDRKTKILRPSLEPRDLVIAPPDPEDPDVTCPVCGSGAIYRYGRTRQGRQRFQCIVCGRQFSMHEKRTEIRNRPYCPVCGSPMHAYKREATAVRFRCSKYPKCRTFTKVTSERKSDP
jgi:transposase-like protein